MKFIDLFSGLGGFHLALKRLNHECVFASEVDEALQDLYEKNFGIRPKGDIRKIKIDQIPSHDILCAGFPCQPFSKAGDQNGLKCAKWGDLFSYVIKVLRYHLPSYFILENVPNLLRHYDGKTWRRMKKRLESLGYAVDEHRLSPHQFGVPQVRERVFIVGCRLGLNGFIWPISNGRVKTSILSSLLKNPIKARPLSIQSIACLEAWQTFLTRFPKSEELPSFPIWSMEFGATYPYEETTPYAITTRALGHYKGSHGKLLNNLSPINRWNVLPSYARVPENRFPVWKIEFIRQNRELYAKNKKWIKQWLPMIYKFPSSLQKLEWNCKGEERNIWKYVIQFRASGVRVKRPSTVPSLVAMTSTQVPVISWEKRYMTPRECANVQSLGDLPFLPKSDTRAFKALGNAVNAHVVKLVAESLIPRTSPLGKPPLRHGLASHQAESTKRSVMERV